MGAYIDGWMDRLMNGGDSLQTNSVYRNQAGRVGTTHGWMDGRMDGWMYGWVKARGPFKGSGSCLN